MKLVYLLVIFLLLGQISLSLRIHDKKHKDKKEKKEEKEQSYKNCFYSRIGDLETNQNFSFTIIKKWNSEQVPLLQNGSLNISEFIQINGWEPYNPQQGYKFFTQFADKAYKMYTFMSPIQSVASQETLQEFGLDSNSAVQIFRQASQIQLFEVPRNHDLVLLQFQIKSEGQVPFESLSVLLEATKQREVSGKFNKYEENFRRLAKQFDLTSLDAVRALNLNLTSIQINILKNFEDAGMIPEVGTSYPIIQDAYLLKLPSRELFLSGPINNGQQNLIQIKDKYQGPKNECQQ